jgi:peptidoglycan/LPS O-acetylase OafA/YrhL
MAVHTPTLTAAAAGSGPAAGSLGVQVAANPMSRLAGVDGLRAVAALWVVLFHIRVFSGARLPFQPLDFFVRSGSTGVSLFLVLSGFCLYLPFAAGKQGRFKTGSFFIRRARRLLPAYYCSLGLALALNVIGGANLGFNPLSATDVAWQIATHTTMIHTLFTSSFYALNGAYWSLGLEWQLYIALPLLIVGIMRFGLWRTLAAAVAVNVVYRLALALAGARGWVPAGLVQTVVLPNLLPGRWAEFAFGMVIAELHARGTLERLPRAVRYAWVPMTVAAVAAVGLPLSHLAFGAVFALLLIAVLATNGVVTRVFSWRPLVVLGIMSYSLYLVHQPLVQAMAFVLRHDFGLSPTRAFGALILLLPLIFAVAWALFVLVERYTLTSRPVEVSGLAAAILFPRFWRREPLPTAIKSGSGPDSAGTIDPQARVNPHY